MPAGGPANSLRRVIPACAAANKCAVVWLRPRMQRYGRIVLKETPWSAAHGGDPDRHFAIIDASPAAEASAIRDSFRIRLGSNDRFGARQLMGRTTAPGRSDPKAFHLPMSSSVSEASLAIEPAIFRHDPFETYDLLHSCRSESPERTFASASRASEPAATKSHRAVPYGLVA